MYSCYALLCFSFILPSVEIYHIIKIYTQQNKILTYIILTYTYTNFIYINIYHNIVFYYVMIWCWTVHVRYKCAGRRFSYNKKKIYNPTEISNITACVRVNLELLILRKLPVLHLSIKHIFIDYNYWSRKGNRESGEIT